jgi:hypothetical protein
MGDKYNWNDVIVSTGLRAPKDSNQTAAEWLDRVADDAEGAFWEVVARAVTQARGGDLPVGATVAFREACRDALREWLLMNVQPSPTKGAVTVTVELRRPRKGERGWWVMDDSTPQAALREVLIESEEMGFEVDSDEYLERPEYDEHGMRIVTVLVAAPTMSPAESWDKLKDLP